MPRPASTTSLPPRPSEGGIRSFLPPRPSEDNSSRGLRAPRYSEDSSRSFLPTRPSVDSSRRVPASWPSEDSSRSALPFGAWSYIGPTPRSSMETTGSNIQQPGFVRKRIKHWMTRLSSLDHVLFSRSSSRNSKRISEDKWRALNRDEAGADADAAEVPGLCSGAFAGMRRSRSYSAMRDEEGIANSVSDLRTVEEVVGPHEGPTSFPVGSDQRTVSHMGSQESSATAGDESARKLPGKSSFEAAGRFGKRSLLHPDLLGCPAATARVVLWHCPSCTAV